MLTVILFITTAIIAETIRFLQGHFLYDRFHAWSELSCKKLSIGDFISKEYITSLSHRPKFPPLKYVKKFILFYFLHFIECDITLWFHEPLTSVI